MYLKEKLEKDILFIDELTQIFNYRFYSRILPQILKSSRNCIFIIFDIDNFKKINDTYGHKFGDFVLKKISENLKNIFKEKNEFPIRYAGDEFVIIIFDIEKEKGINKVREMFEKISNLKFSQNGKEIEVSLSCGISFYPEDALSLEELFRKADDALYYVKRSGKNNFVIYSKISYIREKEKILKSELTPKDIVGFEEEKNLIETGIKEKKGIFIIQGKAGVGKTKFLKYAEKKLLEKNFLTIMSFSIKNDRILPFNIFLRGINFWLDERKVELLKEKGFEKYLKYFPIAGGESKFLIDLEEFFEFLERFLLSFNIVFLIDDASNIDKYSSDFIELMKDKNLFFLSVSDIKYLKPSLIEKGVLIRLSNLPSVLIKDYVENILPGFYCSFEFLEWLKINSENNPFLIEEIIRYLIEKDYIKISKDKFNFEETSEILSKKISLNEIIKERIKNLDEETKLTLYLLSIGERYFDIETTGRYMGINYGRMVDLMERLIEKGFISKISEDIYFFKSSVIKDLIYKNVPEETKKRLHLKMAKTLEELKMLPGFLREPEILKHYEMAGEFKKARELAEKINEFLHKLRGISDLKKLIKIRKRSKIKKEFQFLPLKKELIDDVHLFLKKFYSAIEAIKIYPPNSPTLMQRIKETYETLKNILSLQKNLIIGIYEDKLLINEFEIIEEKAYIKKIKELIEEAKIESIILSEEVDIESLTEFLMSMKEIKIWILKGKSIEEEFERKNLKGIYINERFYVAIETIDEDILEFEKLKNGKFGELFLEEILETAEEDFAEKIKKFIYNEEKLKEIIDENLTKFELKNFNEQKNLLEKIENIYTILPQELKIYVSKKILKIYLESKSTELRVYLKEKLFTHIETIILNDPEEITEFSKREPEIITENFEKLIKVIEILESDKKDKMEKFIVEFARENFEKFTKVLKRDTTSHPIYQEILKTKIMETEGNILKEELPREIIYEILNIIDRENIKINFSYLLDFYKKSIHKEISFKLFKILKEKKIELLKKYFEECIRNKNENEIDKLLIFIKETPDEEFLPFIIKIIEKKKKTEKEFSYATQLKSLEILKKMKIEKYLKEIIEIAKRESFFSSKREKPSFIRLEIIKILINYLREKNNLNELKIFENDKDKMIRLLVKKNLYER